MIGKNAATWRKAGAHPESDEADQTGGPDQMGGPGQTGGPDQTGLGEYPWHPKLSPYLGASGGRGPG